MGERLSQPLFTLYQSSSAARKITNYPSLLLENSFANCPGRQQREEGERGRDIFSQRQFKGYTRFQSQNSLLLSSLFKVFLREM